MFTDRTEREEIERKMSDENSRRADRVGGVSGRVRRSTKAEVAEKSVGLPPQTRAAKKVKQDGSGEGKRGQKGDPSVNMLQVFSELDDCFLKASESANDVSKMLEANRLHYHSNFADNRGTRL